MHDLDYNPTANGENGDSSSYYQLPYDASQSVNGLAVEGGGWFDDSPPQHQYQHDLGATDTNVYYYPPEGYYPSIPQYSHQLQNAWSNPQWPVPSIEVDQTVMPVSDSNFIAQHHEDNQRQIQAPPAQHVRQVPERPATMSTMPSAVPQNAPGLLTRTWDVPPRPKPGRKPADDSPISKRKAQNRQAQRNFRERKAKKVDELEAEMLRMKAEYTSSVKSQIHSHQQDASKKEGIIQELQDLLAQSREEMLRMQQEVAHYRQEMTNAAKRSEMGQYSMAHTSRLDSNRGSESSVSYGDSRWGSIQSASTARSSLSSLISPMSTRPPALSLPRKHLSSVNQSELLEAAAANNQSGMKEAKLARMRSVNSKSPPPPTQQPTPGDEMEVDFTMTYARSQRSSTIPEMMSTSHQHTSLMDTSADDHCGFCTDEGNCACKQTPLVKQPEQMQDIARNTSQLGRPQPMEPKVYMTKPGNCDACRADPAKADFCRSLAAMKPLSVPLKQRPGSQRDSSSSGYISCSDAFDRLRDDSKYVTASETQRETIVRRLNPRERHSESAPTPLEVEDASLLLSLANAPMSSPKGLN